MNYGEMKSFRIINPNSVTEFRFKKMIFQLTYIKLEKKFVWNYFRSFIIINFFFIESTIMYEFSNQCFLILVFYLGY